MSKTEKLKAGLPCVYCGERPSTTRDHPVPRALFVEPLPFDMVTVPACLRCNREKEPLDSYLRDTLVLDIDSSPNPVVQQLIDGKVRRSIASNRSLFFRAAIQGSRWEGVHSRGGIYLGTAVSVPVDDRKVRAQLRFLVRGLYYRVKDKSIPGNYQFEIDRYDRSGIRPMREEHSARSEGAGQIGEDVFVCRYMFAEENEAISYWLLIFYNSIGYGVCSVPPGGLPRSGTDSGRSLVLLGSQTNSETPRE